jgi:hypothetical protein
MARFRVGVILCALLLVGRTAWPEQVAEYQVKAEFIERFTRFVEWPDAREPRSASFVIGVVGANPFDGYLERIARDRKIKGRGIEVRTVAVDQAVDCDVVFIPSSERKNLAAILDKTHARPILTIGDTAGYAEKGVLINFYNAGDQVRFEINESAADRSGLKISSKLFKLARVVGGGQ